MLSLSLHAKKTSEIIVSIRLSEYEREWGIFDIKSNKKGDFRFRGLVHWTKKNMTKGFMDVRNFSGQPLFAQITKMKCLVYTIPEWRYRKDEPDNGMRLDDAIGFKKNRGTGRSWFTGWGWSNTWVRGCAIAIYF